MMKKPTTKKLPEKQVARTVTAKGKPFMKLFSDEKFYQYPRYTNVFVSQYGNVISTTGTVPHLLTPQLASNNYLYVSPCKKGKPICLNVVLLPKALTSLKIFIFLSLR